MSTGQECAPIGRCSIHANLVNSNAVRAVRVGGNLNSGNRANYGLFYRNANNNPGNRNWNYGSALILSSTGRSLERLFCRIIMIMTHILIRGSGRI